MLFDNVDDYAYVDAIKCYLSNGHALKDNKFERILFHLLHTQDIVVVWRNSST